VSVRYNSPQALQGCAGQFIFSTEARAQAREPGGRVGPKGTSGLSQENYFFYFVDLKKLIIIMGYYEN